MPNQSYKMKINLSDGTSVDTLLPSYYVAPEDGGIPKSDLASDVQTSLGKADTALQEHQDISGKADKTATVSTVTYDTTNKKLTKTINGSTTDVVTAAKIVTDGGGITSHQSLANYYTKAEINTKVAGASNFLGTVSSRTGLSVTAKKGDFYRVSTDIPAYSTTSALAHKMDLLIALKDSPAQLIDETNWGIVHGEIDTDTHKWIMNSKDADGYVTKSEGHANAVWGSNNAEIPDWQPTQDLADIVQDITEVFGDAAYKNYSESLSGSSQDLVTANAVKTYMEGNYQPKAVLTDDTPESGDIVVAAQLYDEKYSNKPTIATANMKPDTIAIRDAEGSLHSTDIYLDDLVDAGTVNTDTASIDDLTVNSSITLPNFSIPNNALPSTFFNCSTAGGTQQKQIDASVAKGITTLRAGLEVWVTFTNNNTHSTPTLKIGNLDAKYIRRYVSYNFKSLLSGYIYHLIYNGTYFLVKDVVPYNAASSTCPGLVPLFTTTQAISSQVYTLSAPITDFKELVLTATLGASSGRPNIITIPLPTILSDGMSTSAPAYTISYDNYNNSIQFRSTTSFLAWAVSSAQQSPYLKITGIL